MAQHSTIVGGSTAKRVMNCPGSVALVAKMPPKPSSKYADTGTLLHNVIADVLDGSASPQDFLGAVHEDIALDQTLIDTKLLPALAALDEIDPDKKMEFATETVVGFGDLIPGVFGSADFIGRIGDRAVMLDWKFGDGVAVEVEENSQLMFYVAAAMRTDEAKWAFEGATEIECIIVQPPQVKRWVTTPARIKKFEKDLVAAVKKAQKPDAPLAHGDHCRWCVAKPVCPIMTGAVDRALQTQINGLDVEMIGKYLANADLLETWITDLRALAHQTLEQGKAIPGYKLVPKRAMRQWANETVALAVLQEAGLEFSELTETSVLSPAKTEKVLKKYKLAMPEGLIVAVSSGSTLAPESDPRPAVVQIGRQLASALAKLV